MTNKKQIQTCYWFLEINSGKKWFSVIWAGHCNVDWFRGSIVIGFGFIFFAFDGIVLKIHFAQDPSPFQISSYLSDRNPGYSDRLIEISSTENFNFPMPIIEFKIIQQTQKKTFQNLISKWCNRTPNTKHSSIWTRGICIVGLKKKDVERATNICKMRIFIPISHIHF